MEDVTEKTNPADDFPIEEGSQAKVDPEKQANDIDTARKEWKAATLNVRECDKALAVAKARLAKAGQALTDSRPQMTLNELNAQQRKITAGETRRRVDAQEALAALSVGINPRRQPHPPLFPVEKAKE